MERTPAHVCVVKTRALSFLCGCRCALIHSIQRPYGRKHSAKPREDDEVTRDLRKTLFTLVIVHLALGRTITSAARTSTDGRWVIDFFSSLALGLAQIEADAKV